MELRRTRGTSERGGIGFQLESPESWETGYNKEAEANAVTRVGTEIERHSVMG
jgi:hypothetical protein